MRRGFLHVALPLCDAMHKAHARWLASGSVSTDPRYMRVSVSVARRLEAACTAYAGYAYNAAFGVAYAPLSFSAKRTMALLTQRLDACWGVARQRLGSGIMPGHACQYVRGIARDFPREVAWLDDQVSQRRVP